jgi:hypothetical protein
VEVARKLVVSIGLVALITLGPPPARAQSGALERALASLPDGAFATQAWHADRASLGFVFLLSVTGQPRGTLFEPFVRDLGVLGHPDLVRALRESVPDERAAADVVVDPIRNAGGAVVAYVVRPRDVQVNPAFSRDGRYKIYVRVGETTESGGGAGGGAGGGGM